MSGYPNSDLNPYAPPRSEVAIQPQILRKPKSTKWALAIFVLKMVVITWIHGSIAQEDGLRALVEMYQEDLVSLIAPVTSLLGLFGLLFLGRSLIAYILGGLALVVLCNDVVRIVWRNWISGLSRPDLAPGIVDGGIALIMVSLLLYLGYRFIFGLPSRQYYKIAR